jgi:hypothetical protein
VTAFVEWLRPIAFATLVPVAYVAVGIALANLLAPVVEFFSRWL